MVDGRLALRKSMAIRSGCRVVGNAAERRYRLMSRMAAMQGATQRKEVGDDFGKEDATDEWMELQLPACFGETTRGLGQIEVSAVRGRRAVGRSMNRKRNDDARCLKGSSRRNRCVVFQSETIHSIRQYGGTRTPGHWWPIHGNGEVSSLVGRKAADGQPCIRQSVAQHQPTDPSEDWAAYYEFGTCGGQAGLHDAKKQAKMSKEVVAPSRQTVL
ncbi:hypothetical protein LX32DRAFT_687779 [Colletotrichum zoysiae]|uniref:Uncharacterized protein n=1 Tax=Colletotrichum zoysiae TaxID=1216348 RepID=A0AAD9H2Z0_9PEZI|nr:hypothetical protein LX32DRAFT_687779 [Colletotrichum zoysiae]